MRGMKEIVGPEFTKVGVCPLLFHYIQSCSEVSD
jgi:hypothetical protein